MTEETTIYKCYEDNPSPMWERYLILNFNYIADMGKDRNLLIVYWENGVKEQFDVSEIKVAFDVW